MLGSIRMPPCRIWIQRTMARRGEGAVGDGKEDDKEEGGGEGGGAGREWIMRLQGGGRSRRRGRMTTKRHHSGGGRRRRTTPLPPPALATAAASYDSDPSIPFGFWGGQRGLCGDFGRITPISRPSVFLAWKGISPRPSWALSSLVLQRHGKRPRKYLLRLPPGPFAVSL